MSTNFQKRTSSIFLTILIGLIVISFAITGYQGGSAPTNTIAKVGDYEIDVREYQMGLNNLLRFYAQIYNGGKDLSSSQIESMKLRKKVLGQLIDQKLMIVISDELGVLASPDEVKENIKDFAQNGEKVFYTGDTFDLQKYKGLLASNGLTPQEFEKDTELRIKTQKIRDLLFSFPISNNYIEKIKGLKENKLNAQVAYFAKSSLQKYIPVSKSEITSFLAKEENLKKIKEQFERSKATFSRPEEVKARHILVNDEKKANDLIKKITVKNFAKLANENTEDPSGKNNGGSLGWFPSGRMVPEFDKTVFSQKVGSIEGPVKTQFGYHIIYLEDKRAAYTATFDKHKEDIAKEMIQASRSGEKEKLAKNIQEKLKELLEKNKIDEAQKYSEQYGVNFLKDFKVNKYEGLKIPLKLSEAQTKDLFANESTFVFEDVVYSAIIKTTKDDSKSEDQDDKISNEQRQSFAYLLNSDIQKKYRDQVKIKVFRNIE